MVTEEDLAKLPDLPGVYIMHDASDAIIYVGKALSLKNRVRQYFQPSHDEGLKKKRMVQNIDHFEFIVTSSELEALVLECNLIKEHTPKFNTMLRDDKTYPYIEVTLGETYPRILVTRNIKKNNSKYFGPYVSVSSLNQTIDLIQKFYRTRTCNKKLPENCGKERPCLNASMNICMAPCTGNVDAEEYRANIEEAIRFLNGDCKDMLKELEAKMLSASADMDFENAAKYRDLIEAIKTCILKQNANTLDGEDRDIVAMACDKEDAVVQVFFIRDGKLMGREHFFVTIRVDDEPADVMEMFLKQYYGGTPFIPKEIYLRQSLSNTQLIENWLTDKKGKKVYVRTPKKGSKNQLLELAEKNAAMVLSQDREKIKKEEGRTIGAMKELSELIGIPNLYRMEAFDISNTSGFQSVGSMVVFEGGKPKRSDYRKFRIKSVTGPDDYASQLEVLTRRFAHGLKNKESGDEDSFSRFPDVIMMDGGRGQVNVALQALESLGVSIPVCGMVKDDHHRTRGLFVNNVEIPIDRHSEAFHLITRLQDEAHRFAIEYHRSLRSQAQVKSFLDDISGIGPARRKAIMMHFKSAEEIREASVEELAKVDGMNSAAAQAVYDYLHKKDEE